MHAHRRRAWSDFSHFHTSTIVTRSFPDSRSPSVAENQQISSRRACPPSRGNSLYEQQLAARADRPARAVAFAVTVAVGGAGSVHRQTGMRAARGAPHTRQARQARITGPTWRQLSKSTETGVQNDTQETLDARGVIPAESHAARFTPLTRTGRLRCGREGSQGAAICQSATQYSQKSNKRSYL